MMFRFVYPIILIIALPLVGAWVFALLWKQRPAFSFSLASEAIKLREFGSAFLTYVPLLLRILSVVLLILAAARPQLYSVARDPQFSGVDIMLALDTSASMQAPDLQLGGKPLMRMDVVKDVVNNFIKKRASDRIGVVVFGGTAYTIAPLTIDKGLLSDQINRMEIGMAGSQTALGSAIAVAAKRLLNLDTKTRILILLTDGNQNEGAIAPEEAAIAASASGIKVYVVGVGREKPILYKGQIEGYGDKVEVESETVDDKQLEKIAKLGGGKYFRATDAKALSTIYSTIDKAEKTVFHEKDILNIQEIYFYFLVPALLILVGNFVLAHTVLRIFP